MNDLGVTVPFWGNLKLTTFTEGLEILLLWFIFYRLLKLLKGTRGAQVLSGLGLSVLLVLALTYVFDLHILNWLFSKFSVNIVLAFVVIFQPEIRRALAELGRPNMLGGHQPPPSKDLVPVLVEAVCALSDQKIGALIAIEREIGLRSVEESGVQIDSKVNTEMLTSVFFPQSPLHDGGIVIRGGRVVAASCVFPLSQKEELHRSLGTRHRAAIGITEDTDALVVVVSEETGNISIAYKGRLSRGLEEDRLRRMLNTILNRTKGSGNLDQTSTGGPESERVS